MVARQQVARERKEVVTFKSHSKEAAAEEQGRRKVLEFDWAYSPPLSLGWDRVNQRDRVWFLFGVNWSAKIWRGMPPPPGTPGSYGTAEQQKRNLKLD